MDEPPQDESLIRCYVSLQDRRECFSTERNKLIKEICKTFNIDKDSFCLQLCDPIRHVWADAPVLQNVPNNSELKVVLHDMSHSEEDASSSGSSSPDEDLEQSPGHSTEVISFSEVSHPSFVKLRNGKQLSKQDRREFVKKLFHITSEHTFYPTQRDYRSYIKKLFKEFPTLIGSNYEESQKYWMILLRKKFASVRKEIYRREQRPKLDVTTQTGMGNKPWQVWHPTHQNLPENRTEFQDLSPIIMSLKYEYLKKNPDRVLIERLMCLTYQYRRAFIINMVPKVLAIQEIYPALFNCNELRREFWRIAGKENDEMFSKNLEDYAPIIYDLTKDCSVRSIIDSSVAATEKQDKTYNWKNATLLLMPFLFREDLSFLWFQNQKFNHGQTEPFIKCNANLKTVAKGGGLFQVYVEKHIIAETKDLTAAMECFLASFFVFLIEYRTDLKNTLQLLQSLFFEYDDPAEEQLRPKVVKKAEELKGRMALQNATAKGGGIVSF